jgi:fructose-1,6-bisphosphatase
MAMISMVHDLPQAPAGSTGQAGTFQPGTFMLATFSVYGVPLAAVLLLGFGGAWSLLTRKAGEWFTFAAQIRLEHRQMRDQFR